MTGLNNFNIHPIYLFDSALPDSFSSNALKDFINFIKLNRGKKLIDFCYSCDTDSLHTALTIKENFILDAVPKSLIRDGEDNLKQFLKTLKNPYLKELVLELGDLSRPIKDLVLDELKLASVIKSLLSQSEYIFFLNPAFGLHDRTITKIKHAIEFEAFQRNRKIFIKAQNRDNWLDIAGNIVTKCPNTLQFRCKTNKLLKSYVDASELPKAA